MALTPEQEAAVIALISRTQKTISQLEAETALVGDKILPIENSSGTFAVTVDDVKDYVLKYQDRKSVIINGDMRISQRGTSFSAITDGSYSLDRWRYRKIGAVVHTITQSSVVPTILEAGRKIPFSMKIAVTTADASLAATDNVVIEQPVEGFDFARLAQKESVASIWVKLPLAGVYCLNFRNNASGVADRSLVQEITVNSPNTWEEKIISVPASPSAGTWNYTNGAGCSLGLTLYAGSTYQTTAGIWQVGNFVATSNQVNACASTSYDAYITEVQWKEGSVATPFEQRTIQEELALCQRYFEKSYDLESFAGSGSPSGIVSARAISTVVDQMVPLKISKRAAPSIVIYNNATGAAGSVRNESALTDVNVTPEIIGQNSFAVRLATGFSNGQRATFHYTASSEL